jgi:hypothetical protein
MTEDCYWKHGTPKERHYLCLDGENTVCPRCCVECCSTETPDWFARCVAAGHPPWPSVTYTVPRKLICLESSWDERVFKNMSVKGFFDSLRPLVRPSLQVEHRFIESSKHLLHYLRRPDGVLWVDPSAWDVPIFYLAFHGSPGSVQSVLERIGPDELCEAFAGYGAYPNLIYFGSCSVLEGAKGRKFAGDLLRASGSRAVIGYKKDVNWMDSMVLDLLFLYRFYTSLHTWNKLAETFESVQRDFKPARKMGYTLFQAPATMTN